MYFFYHVKFHVRKSIHESAEISFNIYHNIPKNFNWSAAHTVARWIRSTKVFTAESLCNYIKSADGNWSSWPELQVPVRICKKCNAVHIGTPSKCGCNSDKFMYGHYSLAPKAINLYKQ